MRKLYYVPIVHSPEEFGSLAKSFLEIKKRMHGSQAEKIYRERINRFWKEIRSRLKREGLDTQEKCQCLHIYVDGLPKTDENLIFQKVVQDLISQKLPQYLIIQELLEKGATIHGTESIKLLLEEHSMWTNTVKGISPDLKRKAVLLQERDQFIAKRINETLPKNEIGILFIGAAHKVYNELKRFSDIKMILFKGGD